MGEHNDDRTLDARVSVALLIAQLLVAIVGATTQFPMTVVAGNREIPIDGTAWVGRAQRAYRNMLEGLLPFAAVGLVGILQIPTQLL